MTPMAPRTLLVRRLSVASLLGLIALLILWYGWLAPAAHFDKWLTILLFATPLLFPLRGILYGRPYTHAWTSYLSLFYFMHGTMEAWSNPVARPWALMEVALAIVLFTSCIFYARWRGKELKAAAGTDESG